MDRIGCAIIGSGNIGTDLMMKALQASGRLQLRAMVGIDPMSDGLERARRLGVSTTHEGVNGLLGLPGFDDIRIIFDATSAAAHVEHNRVLQQLGRKIIDLTPAAIGPYVVPAVNFGAALEQSNINMVTCGGQATIPIVHAVNRIAPVLYAEIIGSIASRSAGPGTRANIDEFTTTTARAIESVGGARTGKAIIVLNPAEPPMIMRDTVYCLVEAGDRDRIRQSIQDIVGEVAGYVPGYRLKQDVLFEDIGADAPLRVNEAMPAFRGLKVSVFLEVEGAAHYLPAYAGNLDIMTSAALRAGERLAETLLSGAAA